MSQLLKLGIVTQTEEKHFPPKNFWADYSLFFILPTTVNLLTVDCVVIVLSSVMVSAPKVPPSGFSAVHRIIHILAQVLCQIALTDTKQSICSGLGLAPDYYTISNIFWDHPVALGSILNLQSRCEVQQNKNVLYSWKWMWQVRKSFCLMLQVQWRLQIQCEPRIFLLWQLCLQPLFWPCSWVWEPGGEQSLVLVGLDCISVALGSGCRWMWIAIRTRSK